MNGIKLLLWKNFKILLREKVSLAVSIIFPLICISAFAGLRYAIQPEKYPKQIYNSFSIRQIPIAVRYYGNMVYYAPSNPTTDEIMKIVKADSFHSLKLTYNFRGFKTEEDLYDAYKQFANQEGGDFNGVVLGGVVFKNIEPDGIPENVQYTLKFPGSQRTRYDSLQDLQNARPNWFTGLKWPVMVFGGPRSMFSKFGGFPGYFDEGYLYLQQAVNEAILKILLSATQFSDIKQYDLHLQRFPAPAFTQDKFSFIMQLFMSFFIAAAFTYNVMELTKQIIHEKATRLKEFMKIMGLPNWQHWLGWFLRSYIILVLIAALIVVILKVEITKNVSVLKYSDPLLVFFTLAVYVLNVISFAFLFSSLFSSESSGSTTAAFTWMLLQYYSVTYIMEYFNMTLWEKILCCFLSSNTPSFLIANFLNYYENFGEGLQWSNLWHGLNTTDDFSVGICIIMSALNSVIYIIVALYIEQVFPGEYGVALPWYFPFTTWFWTGKTQERLQISDDGGRREISGAFETEPRHLKVGVEINNLTKLFDNKVALNNLNLKMYHDQVTSLLGPNGAGKTTTMSILTGLIRPTEGTALVNSYDIATEMTSVRESLGFCPQYNILFDNLTVEEHLKFYCQLKGLTVEETLEETERSINVLALGDKRSTLSKDLSGGMKRKLCIGMALSAGSKVVLMDEPTAGVDVEARRAIWDLIKAEKKGRTIILSTHYMEEADLLGDRIAIISDGQLICSGSSLFLKSKFGNAYNLVIVKKETANSNRIKECISKIIPSVKFHLDLGSEISCTLPISEIDSFSHIFEELDRKKEELSIGTYGVGSSTLEEIFVRVTSRGNSNSLTEPESESPVGSESSTRLGETTREEDSRRNQGLKLIRQQLWALTIKKILISNRRKSVFLLQVVIPLMAMVGIFKVYKAFPGQANETDEVNSVKQMQEDFGTSTSFLKCLPDSHMCEAFKSTLEGYQDIKMVEDTSVVEAIMNELKLSRRRDEGKYLLAFEEYRKPGSTRKQLTVLFNNQPFHVPPVALNVLHNGLLKFYGLNNTITTINHPFDHTNMDDIISFYYINSCITFGASVCASLGFLAGAFALVPLSERISKFKYLQIMAGVKLPLYWLTDFVINLMFVLVYFVGMIIATIVFDIEPLLVGEVRMVLFNCILCFAWATLTSCMLLSTIMKDSTMAYSRILAINIFGSVMLVAYGLLRSPELGITGIVEDVNSVFSFLPSYGFGMSVFIVGRNGLAKRKCAPINIPRALCTNGRWHPCCEARTGYYDWDFPGVGKFIVKMMGVGTFCLLLLIFVEFGLISKLKRILASFFKKWRVPPSGDEQELLLDADIMEENHRIENSTVMDLSRSHSLLAKNLSKTYQRNLKAVNGISFGVKKGEVFGLLGINGAGKTTTFKLLTGDESITSGDAYVNEYSVKTDLRKARSNLGYCPQYDACVDELTGKETLVIFARLKGVPEDKIQDLVLKTSENLMYQHFLDDEFGRLSGGNKRKLSTAIAMLGEPSLILLDEPTAGMDPVARRHVWNAIGKVRDGGASVLLTSHNMEECEALCSTLAIMVKGQFKCLGSPQHLKSKLCPGYKLVVQLPFQAINSDSVFSSDCDKWNTLLKDFHEFLVCRFPGCVLKDSHFGFLEYLLPTGGTTWGKIFSTMEEVKRTFHLEGYNVGQVDLEQVFFNFASE